MSSPIRILHLEDRPEDAELAQETLRAKGIPNQAIRVDTQRAFVEALQAGGFDLILSDFSIPGFGGDAALEEASRLRPDTPFVFVSGTIGEENAVELLKRGATDYVLKDHLARLPSAVSRALQEVRERLARRRAEETLAMRDEFLRRVSEASPIILTVLDLVEDRLLYVGGAAETVLGYTSAELLAMGPDFRRQLYDADEQTESPGWVARLQASAVGEVSEFLVRVRHRDGGLRNLKLRATIFARAPDGSPTQALGVATDVTTETRAQLLRETQYAITMILAEGLSAAETRERVLEALGSGLGFTVAEWWSAEPAPDRVAAWCREDPEARAFLEVGDAPNGEGLVSRVRDSRQLDWGDDLDREPRFGRSRLAAKARLRSWVALPVCSDSLIWGVVLCVGREPLGAPEDLLRMLATTGSQLGGFLQKHAADERIREQAELLDKASDAITVRDASGRLRYCNKAAERLYGWKSHEALQPVESFELVETEPKDALAEARAKTLADGAWAGEFELRAGGRSVVLGSRWSLLRDAAGKAKSFLVMETDVTQQKKLQSQLLRNQRMESLGTLAGGIAHDLNNVLAPVLTATELLKKGVTDERGQRFLKAIETSALRGAEMVKQVLTFARGAEGQRTVLQPRQVLREIETMARETFPRVIELRNDIAADLRTVSGDATQLHQVLLNLCVNARDAMPNGGILTLSAQNAALDAHYAALHVDAKPGCYVVLGVTDTGLGMPRGVIDRIFEPFFTTKGVGKGTGLGLSTTLAIVKAHAGFITVYSEPGRGTTFKVHLPAWSGAAAAAPAPQAEPPAGRGETILVVDDEAGIREVTKETLESYGYEVLTAVDGADAVATAAAHRGEIDVVVTDMNMPVMDGLATMRALRRIDSKLKLIGTSGLPSNAEALADLFEGDTPAFLPKPYSARDLLSLLRRLLDA